MGLGKTLSDKRNPNFYTKKGTIVRTHADVDVDDDLAASQLCITLGFTMNKCLKLRSVSAGFPLFSVRSCNVFFDDILHDVIAHLFHVVHVYSSHAPPLARSSVHAGRDSFLDCIGNSGFVMQGWITAGGGSLC